MANEKRLIDANALSGEVDNSKYNNPHTNGRVKINHYNEHDHFLKMIMDAPTVDAVEVVRCKDCKKWEYDENFSGWCTEWRRRTHGNHFCSYGERREDNVE